MTKFSNDVEAARTRSTMLRVRKLLDQLPRCACGCGRHLPFDHPRPWCDACIRAGKAQGTAVRMRGDTWWRVGKRTSMRRGGVGGSKS